MFIENTFAVYKTTRQPTASFHIDFYNSNKVFLNSIKQFRDSEELSIFIELNWYYLNDLSKRSYLNDLVDAAEKIRPLIDAEIKRLGAEKLRDNKYFGLLYYYAVASYDLHDYKTATPLFRELIKFDQKNDKFKKWLEYSIYGQRKMLLMTISIVSLLVFLAEIFFGKKYLLPWARVWIDAIAFIGIMTAIGCDYYVNRKLIRRKRP